MPDTVGTLMAGWSLAETGAQRELLSEAIAGNTVLAFAHEEPQSRHDLADVNLVAERHGDGWALTGAKAVVPQLEAADRIVVSARLSGAPRMAAGIGLFVVARDVKGVAVRGYPMIDGGRGGELELEGAPATLICESGHRVVEAAIAAGIVAVAWEAVGIMDMLEAATLDYLRTRKQFGVPIGKFQALQHRMATMALETFRSSASAQHQMAGRRSDGRISAVEHALAAPASWRSPVEYIDRRFHVAMLEGKVAVAPSVSVVAGSERPTRHQAVENLRSERGGIPREFEPRGDEKLYLTSGEELHIDHLVLTPRDMQVFNELGRRVMEEKGELICVTPMPSMPIGLWNDADDSKYRRAYFERFANVWAHGDSTEENERGGFIIHGCSDAVLNPGSTGA